VPDSDLGHDGDRDGGDDVLNHLRVRHPRDSALGSDIGRDSLESHNGASTSLFGDPGLLDVDNIDDDTSLELSSVKSHDGTEE
jgi:hypothetical protein